MFESHEGDALLCFVWLRRAGPAFGGVVFRRFRRDWFKSTSVSSSQAVVVDLAIPSGSVERDSRDACRTGSSLLSDGVNGGIHISISAASDCGVSGVSVGKDDTGFEAMNRELTQQDTRIAI